MVSVARAIAKEDIDFSRWRTPIPIRTGSNNSVTVQLNDVVGIAVEQLRGLVVENLAQQRGDRLALVEPLAPQLGQHLGSVGLVERDEARDPTIAEVRRIERVEDSRPAHIGEAQDGERAKMLTAKPSSAPKKWGRSFWLAKRMGISSPISARWTAPEVSRRRRVASRSTKAGSAI